MWILPKNYPLSSHYVADMVESSEDLSLLDTIIGSSLFVRSKPMSKSSLSRKWKRDKWFRHLCGQILKPSQHRSFETRLISYLQAILANRLAKPVDGGGEDDPRHLWPYIKEHIRTIRPVRCFFENVQGHITLGLSTVISDLEELGYRTTWGIFSAEEVGAPHQRKRVFILADATSQRIQRVRPNREQELSTFFRKKIFDGSSYEFPARPGQDQYEWEEPRVV